MGRILVGVDGSEGARKALVWAADEAALRGAALEAVFVYQPPRLPSYYAPFGSEAVMSPPSAQEEKEAREHASQVLASTLDALTDHVQRDAVERTVIPDFNVAEALIRLSKDADMLVVGSRGLGGFRGLMLGSVSTKAVQHAPCTVVVVQDR